MPQPQLPVKVKQPLADKSPKSLAEGLPSFAFQEGQGKKPTVDSARVHTAASSNRGMVVVAVVLVVRWWEGEAMRTRVNQDAFVHEHHSLSREVYKEAGK